MSVNSGIGAYSWPTTTSAVTAVMATVRRIGVLVVAVVGGLSTAVSELMNVVNHLVGWKCKPTGWFTLGGMAYDAEQTRQELLTAATEEFAEHGLAGARVDRIAAAAGVNKQRIYGHFGGKDELFDAVLARTMRAAAASKPLQPGETPGGYIARTFDFHGEQPQLLQLLMWEALSRPVATATADSERREHYADKIESMMAMAG